MTVETRTPRLAFLVAHGKLTGGAKIFYELGNRLRKTGIDVCFVARDARPAWADVQAPWLQVPQGESLGPRLAAFDLVFVMFWTNVTEAKTSGRPVVLFEQGDTTLFQPEIFEREVVKRMDDAYRLVDHIVTVGPPTAEEIASRVSRASTIIPIAVDGTRFTPRVKPRREKPQVLVVAQDELEFKGVKDVFDALQRLRDEGMRLTVIQVSATGVRKHAFDRFVVTNPKPHVLSRLFAESDLLVSGSRFESFGLPPLEAMASGTAVVTADNRGIHAYGIHMENCVIVPPKDPQALADAIRLVLSDEDLRKSLVHNGLRTARQFSWENTVSRYADYLHTIVSNH